MSTVLITGANRGIGLEFCRQYAEEGWQVIACCRNIANAFELFEMSQLYPNFQIETLDVAQFVEVEALSKTMANVSIDILINNAGVYDDNRINGFGTLDFQDWNHSFLINTQAPVKMVESFLSHIKRSEKKLIVNISSLMGSMTDNGSGGSLFYRTSKAALNAAMKTLSIDLKQDGIGVLILHPGWVQTDMGGSNALIDCETSVSGMRKVIENFNPAQSGAFVKYDGNILPW